MKQDLTLETALYDKFNDKPLMSDIIRVRDFGFSADGKKSRYGSSY